jgi:hypothetical protein
MLAALALAITTFRGLVASSATYMGKHPPEGSTPQADAGGQPAPEPTAA